MEWISTNHGECCVKSSHQFCLRKIRTVVCLPETTYEKGVKICGKDMQAIEERLKHSDKLPLYDITVTPLVAVNK
jgi:hypothetical protein